MESKVSPISPSKDSPKSILGFSILALLSISLYFWATIPSLSIPPPPIPGMSYLPTPDKSHSPTPHCLCS